MSLDDLDDDGRWVDVFADWAGGYVDVLDFDGCYVPPRVVELLRAAYPDFGGQR